MAKAKFYVMVRKRCRDPRLARMELRAGRKGRGRCLWSTQYVPAFFPSLRAAAERCAQARRELEEEGWQLYG